MGQAHSDTEAIRAVVEWVAAAAESAGEAVLICEDAALALRIDEALVASGLPSMGVPDPSPAGPILQVLPLALALCWDPVAPELLLDFLSLPTRPVRARAARKLAHALEEQPGLGSGAWTSCVAELTSFEADPKGEVAERIETWLECSRAPAGEEIRTSLVRSRCSEVSRWAAGYAAHLRAERPDDGRVPSLEQLAARAALVGELAEAQGRSMTEPQLARLHEACARHGGSTASRAPEAGCVRFVSSAADLHPPCARVVWLGHGTSVHLAQPWSRRTIEALQRAGLAIDDGAARAAGLRSAERRGLAVVEESLLMVSLPRDAEERPHPLWTRVRAGLRDERGADLDPVPLSEVLEGSERMAPWSLRALSHPVAPPHGIRTLWTLPPGSFEERAYRSATEVQTRLACPLKWVLEYAASIRPSPIANLPDSFLLKGSFCHQVLERVLSEYVGVRVPVEEVVARTRAVFDERVALDAAPLATRAATTERMALRESLTNSVSTLWALIEGGRYVLDALEAEVRVSAPVEGDEPSALLSFVDCVLRDEEGRPAVVDFKYAGAKKYPTLLKEGRALQLAFYARALGAERSVELADIRAGYLIIDVARLFTPEGSSLLGAGDSTVEDAPPISETWETLRRALAAAEGWLREGEAVPARPLQAAEDRPEGAEIALGSAAELKKGKVEACRYCAYPALCGLRGLQ